MANTFRVSCSCGQAVAGQRQPRHQAIPCPGCGARLFILPASPWNHLQPQPPPAAARSKTFRRRDWLLPLGAVALTVAALVGVFAWMMAARQPQSDQEPNTPLVQDDGLAEVRRQLAQGSYRQAVATLDRLGRTSGAARQLRREAALLAELLAEPLEDLVRHAAGMSDPDWQHEWKARYHGKALVLEAEFRPGPDGVWQCDYPLLAEGEKIRLAVDNLTILSLLPAPQPTRLLLGVRLASLKREPPGPAWVVRFEPDDGVLLTQPEAAARCCPDWGEERYQAIFRDQASWLGINEKASGK